MDKGFNEQWWRRRAARLARRVCRAWWISWVLPRTASLNLVAAAVVLAARTYGMSASSAAAVYGVFVISVAAAGAVLRRPGYSMADALVAMESAYGLHSRLTAASQGVGDWPPPVDVTGVLYRWNLRRASILPIVSLLPLAASLWVPVRPAAPAPPRTLAPPVAWEITERWLDTLEQSESLDVAGLDALRERLEQLRQQPMDQWYSHGSLEAGDSLQQRAEADMHELARNIEAAWTSAHRLRDAAGEVGAEGTPTASAEWREALRRLAAGALTVEPELLRRMQALDPAGHETWTEADAAIRQALEAALQACRACQGQGEKSQALAGEPAAVGSGRPGRGPGAAPMILSPAASASLSDRIEPLPADRSRPVTLGDILAVVETQHDLDPSRSVGPQAAGAIAAPGRGGQAVWRERLAPAEQAVVSRYFR